MSDLLFSPPVSGMPPLLEWVDGKVPYALPADLTPEGFAVMIDDGEQGRPACVHTVGLTGYGLPELVFFGPNQKQLHNLWNALRDNRRALVQSGLLPGSRLELGRLAGIAVPVCPEGLQLLSAASQKYQRKFSAVQLYWVVGAANQRPKPAEIEFLARQPYLGHGTLRRLLEGG